MSKPNTKNSNQNNVDRNVKAIFLTIKPGKCHWSGRQSPQVHRWLMIRDPSLQLNNLRINNAEQIQPSKLSAKIKSSISPNQNQTYNPKCRISPIRSAQCASNPNSYKTQIHWNSEQNPIFGLNRRYFHTKSNQIRNLQIWDWDPNNAGWFWKGDQNRGLHNVPAIWNLLPIRINNFLLLVIYIIIFLLIYFFYFWIFMIGGFYFGS